jgi:hypothetical protein
MRTARPKAYHRLVMGVHAEKAGSEAAMQINRRQDLWLSFIFQKMLGIQGRRDCWWRQRRQAKLRVQQGRNPETDCRESDFLGK